MLPEAFHADDGVVALGVCIIRRFAGPAEVEHDTVAIGPEIELLRGELAALVDADRFGMPVPPAGLFERVDHFHGGR